MRQMWSNLLKPTASGDDTARHQPVIVSGAQGSLASLAVAQLASHGARAKDSPPLLVLCADEPRAAQLMEELSVFWHPPLDGGDPLDAPAALLLPEMDSSPYSDLAPDRRTSFGRLAVLFRLLMGHHPPVLAMSIRALLRRVIPPELYDERCELVVEGKELDRDGFASTLTRAGYQRLPIVEDPGTYTVRGGVLDFFPPVYRYPVRLELEGDQIRSLGLYDPESQRTLRRVDHAYVHPVRETLVTRGAAPREKLLALADLSAHPSSRVRFLLSQIEDGADFFGADSLMPIFHSRLAPLWEYFPKGTRWVMEEPETLWETGRAYLRELEGGYRERIEDHQLAVEPRTLFVDPSDVQDHLREKVDAPPPVHLVALVDGAGASPARSLEASTHTALVHEVRQLQAERGQEVLGPLAKALSESLALGRATYVVSPDGRSTERLVALLGRHDLPVRAPKFSEGYPLPDTGPSVAGPSVAGPSVAGPSVAEPSVSARSGTTALKVEIRRGHLAKGFTLLPSGPAFFAEEEIFGPKVRRTQDRGRSLPRLGDISELLPGDFAVHQLHGVGRYEGLRRENVRGVAGDFMLLTYHGDARLYLPVHRFAEVHRYVAAEGRPPRMDRLGGSSFAKSRSSVKESVRKLAEMLLQLYAQRAALPGHAVDPPDELYRAFEATFPFEETPDQQAAIEAVEGDLCSPRPMDRLVCGDVGYGKTEVALRAAVLTVLGGRQVALLAPTTVLVEQHFATFSERLKGFPLRVTALSRFRTRQAQERALEALAAREIDIVIGTHRLLSGDVRFADLGLVIVDEEQRFGVAHKERLKALRTQVDVLTLTATPIPRTLHMSLLGLRDLSLITTPPSHRLAVRTHVCVSSPHVIRDGIRRELARGGQVYFVVPRIGASEAGGPATTASASAGPGSLPWWAETIRQQVPEARVAEAHGQLMDRTLERVMSEFVAGQHDVLVCTSLVESGLDISRANTMFIQDADRFGLAQLYQLRGRIGRGRERAVCLLMVSSLSAITPEARQRLEALGRFSDLGAGFNLATTDLEIRGTGDLLGGRQSGNINSVGFEEYTRIMEESVAELKGEPLLREEDPDLVSDLPSFLPDDYIEEPSLRLHFYKKFADIRAEADAEDLLAELTDRFGHPPPQAMVLSGLMVLKAFARRLRAVAVDLSGRRLGLTLNETTPLDPTFVRDLVSRKKSPWRFGPDFKLIRRIDSTEGDLAKLEEAKNSLRDLVASVR